MTECILNLFISTFYAIIIFLVVILLFHYIVVRNFVVYFEFVPIDWFMRNRTDNLYSSNIWTMDEYMKYGWIYELWMNIWTMDEYVNYGWIYELWMNIWTMDEYMNYGWIYELWMNIWTMDEYMNYGWIYGWHSVKFTIGLLLVLACQQHSLTLLFKMYTLIVSFRNFIENECYKLFRHWVQQ